MLWNPLTELPNLTGCLPTWDWGRFYTGTASASSHPVEYQDYRRIDSGVGGLIWTSGALSSSPWLKLSGLKSSIRCSVLGSVASANNRIIDLTGSTTQFNHFHASCTGYIAIWVKFDVAVPAAAGRILDSRSGSSTNTGFTLFRNVTTGQIIFQLSKGTLIKTISGGAILDTNWHLIEVGCAVGTNASYVKIDGVGVFDTLGAPGGTNASFDLRLGAANGGTSPAMAQFKNMLITSAIPSAPDLALIAAFNPDFIPPYDTSLAITNGVLRFPVGGGAPVTYLAGGPLATDRGTALRTANAAAADGDGLLLGATDYDVGSASSFELVGGAALWGCGKALTTVRSTITKASDSNKCALQFAGAGSVVGKLFLHNDHPNQADYSFPIGRSNGGGGVATNAAIYDSRIKGYSDSVYIDDTDLGNSIIIVKTLCESAYDTIAVLRSNAGDYVRTEESTFNSTGPFLGADAQLNGPPGKIYNNIITRGGVIDLNNSFANTLGTADATIVTCLRTQDGAGVINAVDTFLHVDSIGGTATGVYDVDNDGSGGTITVTRGGGSGADGTPTKSGDTGVTFTGPFSLPPATGGLSPQLFRRRA